MLAHDVAWNPAVCPLNHESFPYTDGFSLHEVFKYGGIHVGA